MHTGGMAKMFGFMALTTRLLGGILLLHGFEGACISRLQSD